LRPRALTSFLLAATLALVCASVAGAADLVTYALGVPGHPFGFAHRARDEASGLDVVTEYRSGGADQSLRIAERGPIWSTQVPSEGVSAGPLRSVDWAGIGEVLLTCGRSVLVLGEEGSSPHVLTKLVWSYTDPDVRAPCWARKFIIGSEPYVVIADPAAHRVFAVSYETKQLVWQFGATGEPGVSPGRLLEPVCAEYVAQGTDGAPTVLIADAAAEAPRVVEVSWAANLVASGDPGGGIVWQLSAGATPGGLVRPVQAQRLDGAVTLVADAGRHRIFAVDSRGALRWQYGVSGSPGSAPGYLDAPIGAAMLSNDRTLIVDGGNRRVIAVRTSDYRVNGDLHGWEASSIRWQYPSASGGLDDPAAVRTISGRAPDASGTPRPADGAVLLCDRATRAVMLLGNNGGAKADSRWIDCGRARLNKRFLSLRWSADVPAGTSLRLWYAGSDGVWRPQGASGVSLADGAGVYKFPTGLTDTRLKYTVSLTTNDRGLTPTLYDLALTYRSATVKAKGGHGGAATGTGGAPGSGPLDVSGIGGSGAGTGSGSGSGGGSGTGTGSGSGAGQTQGGTAATGVQGASQAQTGPPAETAAQEASSGAVSVVGLRVGTAPSGGTSGAGGGSAAGGSGGRPLWLTVGLSLVAIGALLAFPGLVVDRRRKRLCAFDHTRRRFARPVTL
jgi:hypothetical protein